MIVLEKDVEQYLKNQIHIHKGLCWKWVSPGTNGVPDRIVVCHQQVVFVELKRPHGGKASALQKLRWQQLLNQGQMVQVISTKQQVDELVTYLTSEQTDHAI